MTTANTVYGTDGNTPIHNPEGLWKCWAEDEIYFGEIGLGKYVPKIGDHVVNKLTNFRQRVSDVNMTTLVATLEPFEQSVNTTQTSNDLLFATNPGWPSQAFRIYLDDTVFPHRLDVDTFLSIRSVKASYVKIIHGSLYGQNEVISMVFDATGEFVSEKVGLDLLALEQGWENHAIKTIKTCNCVKKFVNGDVLTLVVYSSDGHVLNTTCLSVVNSNFIRDLNAPKKYVTHISLETPFASSSDPNLILLPLNWTKDSMNLTGVVHYNDGSSVKLPVDGRKFTMRGLSQLLSSIPGHDFDLVLHYSLETNEATYHETSSFNNGINLPVKVKLVDANLSYSVKLFVFPYWDTSTQAFKLQFFMLNLERKEYLDVTGSVRVASGSETFNGYSFGATQRLQLTLNLKDVRSTFKSFTHTQISEVTLYGKPTDFKTPWVVKHSLGDNLVFGNNLSAKFVDSLSLKIDNEFGEKNTWLSELYVKSNPLTHSETSLIEPSHFYISYGGVVTLFDIDSWNKVLKISSTLFLYKNIYVIFVKKISTGELFLSMAGLSINY